LSAKVDLRDVTAESPAWVTALPRAAPLRLKTPEQGATQQESKAKNDAADSPRDPQSDVESADVESTDAESADAESLAPQPEPGPEPTQLVSYDRMAFDLQVKRDVAADQADTDQADTDQTNADQASAERWELSASNIDFTRKSSSWRASRLAANWLKDDAGKLQLSAQADRVVLQNLWPLLAYLPESAPLAHIRALQASGTIENLALDFQRASAGDPPQYSLQADIADAAFQPVLRAPGLSGLTAHVQGTDAGGEIQLDAKNLQLALPRMFRAPLQAQSISGVIAWKHDPAGWRLGSKNVRVASEDGHAQASIELTIPADGSSPILDLNAQARDLNVAATKRYLPADKLTAKSLEWLDRAFVSGRVPQGQVTYKGPTRAFPFRHGEGEFIARGRVEDVTFDYQPGWSPATQLAADVEFRNQGMKVTAGTANVGELNVANIDGNFADFKTGLITVKAQASGDLGSALKLLQTSPIRDAFGAQFQKLRGRGETRSTVEMALPLKQLAERQIAVIAELRDTTVSAQGLDAPITNLSGSLSVRQALPDSASMRGQWLGGPLYIALRT
jgi:uncharacterized protein YhdP